MNSLSWVLILVRSDFTWKRIGRPIGDRYFSYLLTLSLLTRIKTQLSISGIHFEYAICFANSPWNHSLVRDFTLNPLSHPRNHYVNTFFFAKTIWILNLLRTFAIYSLSVSQIHLWNQYEITICFANCLWLHYLFREFILNPLSLSWFHNEFTKYFGN